MARSRNDSAASPSSSRGGDAASSREGEEGARAPRSKVEPYAHLLGVETDAEVARRAGVSPETARIYRVKQGIPSAAARNREWALASDQERRGEEPQGGEGGDALPPEYEGADRKGGRRKGGERRESEEPNASAAAGESERPLRRGGQASPIDAHFASLGRVSDSEVARLAGVSTAAVSQYRRRRGIPSSVAGAGEGGMASQAPASEGGRSEGAIRAIAWLVVVRRADGEQSYIVVGSDVADAAQRAVRSVGSGAEVISVTRHMDALT